MSVADATYWFNQRMESGVRAEDRGISHEHKDGRCAKCGGSLCPSEVTCAWQGINDAEVGDARSRYRPSCKCGE